MHVTVHPYIHGDMEVHAVVQGWLHGIDGPAWNTVNRFNVNKIIVMLIWREHNSNLMQLQRHSHVH